MSEEPKLHFFICTNEKSPEKSSCALNSNLDPKKFRAKLKEICRERWGKQVRINTAGCLGKCSRGVTAVIYPQGKWFFELREDHFEEILEYIEENLA